MSPQRRDEWATGRAYVPDWAFTSGREPDEIAQTIERIHRDRQRRSREVIRYGEPRAMAAEELVLPPPWASMRPDEYLDACNRRSMYVACRAVTTVDRDQARRAGL